MSNMLYGAALEYAARGWPVFPCHPRSKIPATPHGFKDATTDPDLIRAWWEQEPDYNVAIATGEASGTFVLDLDDKPGRPIEEAMRGLGIDWPTTPTVRTGGGGVQFFHAYPKGSNLTISGGKLGFGIDTRGNGGYVVAPPSVHPSGGIYKWMDFEDAPLTPTPASIITKLETQRTRAFLAASEKITDGPSGRHHALMTAAALMRGIGMVPREIIAALREMVSRLDLSDGRVITDKELRDIADWTGDKSAGMLNIEAVLHGDKLAKSIAKQSGEAAAEMVEDDFNGGDPGPFPDRLLDVPGFVGRLAAYTNEQSNRPQPVFALAGALAALSVLTGRKVESETRGRTNCYVLTVAPSGSGKDAARQTNKMLFHSAGCEELLGAEDFASDSGIVSAVERQPAVLFQVDEIGHVLRAVNDPRAPAHLAGINAVLMRLYSSATATFKGKAYRAAKDTPTIVQPHAALYGTTTPDRFWSSISRSAIEDGLLGRCLIFTGKTTRQRLVRGRPVPPDLIEEAKWWHKQPCGPGNVSSMNPGPRLVHYDDAGEAVIEEFLETSEREREANAGRFTEPLWARAVQRVDQLALLYACSANPYDPVIDAAAATWARDMILYLTSWLAWAADRHLAENESESIYKRMLRVIEEAGADGIEKRSLARATQWIRGRRRERDELLAEMVSNGHVIGGERETKTKPATVYVHRRFVPAEYGGSVNKTAPHQ